jgi:hypothetical protein
MSFEIAGSSHRGNSTKLVWVGAFALAYFAASGLDLWTTELALLRPDASEANIYATNEGQYSAAKGWAITAIGGVLMIAWFAFGVFNAHRVSPQWLRHPVRSLFHLYSNPLVSIPWSRRVLDRSPLHAIAITVAFVVFRILAAINNALIALGLDGPISMAIRQISVFSSPMIGFLVAVAAFYVAIILTVSPLAARFTRLISA